MINQPAIRTGNVAEPPGKNLQENSKKIQNNKKY